MTSWDVSLEHVRMELGDAWLPSSLRSSIGIRGWGSLCPETQQEKSLSVPPRSGAAGQHFYNLDEGQELRTWQNGVRMVGCSGTRRKSLHGTSGQTEK